MSQTIGFHRPLISAIHKGSQPALMGDCIALAATQYAMNAGAANNIKAVRDACLMSEKGKARTPAVGTLAALVLASMDAILQDAPAAGARSEGKGEERTPAVRQVIADAYGLNQRTAYVAAVDKAAAARRVKADERKEAAKEAAPAPTTEGAPVPEGSITVRPLVAADIAPSLALQALDTLSDVDLMVLASKHPTWAARIVACMALPAAAAGAAASQTIKRAQRAPKAPVASIEHDDIPAGAMAAAQVHATHAAA